ncbi:MAG: tripartite tricarboxylate transporter TctB family protein [Oscillospiraceae bacterium]
MSSRLKDLYSGIFFLMFAVFIYVESYFIRVSKADALGPQFFPRLVAIAMAFLALLQIIRYVKTIKTQPKPQTDTKVIPFWKNAPLILTFVLLAGYVILVDKLGFIIVTAIYLFCQIFLLLPKGAIKVKRNLIITSGIAVIVPVFIYFLFYKVFMIFLPAGILG